jgi:hypothetical protein
LFLYILKQSRGPFSLVVLVYYYRKVYRDLYQVLDNVVLLP